MQLRYGMYFHNEVHLRFITARCTLYCRREYRDPECYCTYCGTVGFASLLYEIDFERPGAVLLCNVFCSYLRRAAVDSSPPKKASIMNIQASVGAYRQGTNRAIHSRACSFSATAQLSDHCAIVESNCSCFADFEKTFSKLHSKRDNF